MRFLIPCQHLAQLEACYSFHEDCLPCELSHTEQVPWSHWTSARSWLPSSGHGHSQSAPAGARRPGGMCSGLTWKHHILSMVPSTQWVDFLALFSPFSHQIHSALFTCGLNVCWSHRVGFRASAVFLWDFPPTVCGSARAAHLELFLQVLKFKIEVSSKTCRTTNCDLGLKKEAVSSIWLPGKYSVERLPPPPLIYLISLLLRAFKYWMDVDMTPRWAGRSHSSLNYTFSLFKCSHHVKQKGENVLMFI